MSYMSDDRYLLRTPRFHDEVLVGVHLRSRAVAAASTVPKVANQATGAGGEWDATHLGPAIRALVRQVRASSRGRPERGRSPDATWGSLVALADAGLLAQRRAIECAVAACGAVPVDRELFLRWAGVRGVAETFEQLASASPLPLTVRTIRMRVAKVRESLPGALAVSMPPLLLASSPSPPRLRTATVPDITLAEFRANARTMGQERLLRAAFGATLNDARARRAKQLGSLGGSSDGGSDRTLDALALLAQELLHEKLPDDLVRGIQGLSPNGRWRLRRRGWAALTAAQPALLRRPSQPHSRYSQPPRLGPPAHPVVAVEGIAAAAMMVRSEAVDHEMTIEAVEAMVSAGDPLAELAIDLMAPEVFEPQRVGRELVLRARLLGLGVMARAGRPDAVMHYDAITALAPAGCDDALSATIDFTIHQVLAGEANRAAGGLGRQLRGLAGRRQPLDPFVAYYLHLWAAEVCERTDSRSTGRDAARNDLLAKARVFAEPLHDQPVRAVELTRVEALGVLRARGPCRALDLLDDAATRGFGTKPWPIRPGLFHTAALGCRTALMCEDDEQFRRFATELARLLGPTGRTPALSSAAMSLFDRGEQRFDWRP